MGRSRTPLGSPKAPPVPTDLNLFALEGVLAEAPGRHHPQRYHATEGPT